MPPDVKNLLECDFTAVEPETKWLTDIIEQNKLSIREVADQNNASARLYSIIETVKANGLEPYHYLKHLFTELPKANSEADVQKLLPWQIDPLTLE